MRPTPVVVSAPIFNNDFRFFHGHKHLTVQQLVPQFAVEAFAVAVLPGTAGLNVLRLNAQVRQPSLQRQGDKLRAVVRAEVVRSAVRQKQIRKHMHSLLGSDIPGHVQGKAFPAVFVDNHQHAEGLAVRCSALHEVTAKPCRTIHSFHSRIARFLAVTGP